MEGSPDVDKRERQERMLVKIIGLMWPGATDSEVRRALDVMIPYGDEMERMWPNPPDHRMQREYEEKVVAILGPAVGSSRWRQLKWRMGRPLRAIRHGQPARGPGETALS